MRASVHQPFVLDLVVNQTIVVTDTSDPGCTAADHTVAGSPMTVTGEVPAGSAPGAWTGATIALENAPDRNQDDCQNATVNLTYAIAP